jgi:hypothetical protein
MCIYKKEWKNGVPHKDAPHPPLVFGEVEREKRIMPKCAFLFKDGTIGVADVSEHRLNESLRAIQKTEEEIKDPTHVWGIDEAPTSIEFTTFYPTKVFATISTIEEKVVHTVFIEA